MPDTYTTDALATIDEVVDALYATISGEAGAPRDWARIAQLFVPDARLVPMMRGEDGAIQIEQLDTAAYRASRAPYFERHAFYEWEVARRTEEFGSLAHVWSTYVSARTPRGTPFMRGVNSIQLIRRDGRWWVLSMAWFHESPVDPVPARYLERDVSDGSSP